jgi:hypothetical protein
MGDEMFYRYQQSLIDEAAITLGALLQQSSRLTTAPPRVNPTIESHDMPPLATRRTLLAPAGGIGEAAGPPSFRVVRVNATPRVCRAACHEGRGGYKRKFWWSELSKWDDHVKNEWIQWIELVAGLSAMIVLTLSLLAVWDGKSP